MHIFALLYSIGSGGVIALATVICIIISLQNANIGDALDLGWPIILLALIAPIVLQPWKDDSEEMRNTKRIMQTGCYCLFVAMMTWLIFLSGAFFLSLIFVFLGVIFILTAEVDDTQIGIKGKFDFMICCICFCMLSVFTFEATILTSKILDSFNILGSHSYYIMNANGATCMFAAIPMLLGAILGFYFLAWTVFACTNNVLFHFSDTINRVKRTAKNLRMLPQELKGAGNEWRELLTTDNIGIIAAFVSHIVAFCLARYLASVREFSVFVTNFQIDSVSNETSLISTVGIPCVGIAFIIGQKIIKKRYRDGISTKQTIVFSLPFLLLFVFFSIILPFSTMSVSDPSDELAIKLMKEENSFRAPKCPVCHNKQDYLGTPSVFYIGYGNNNLCCSQCDAKWYIRTPKKVEHYDPLSP